MSEFDNFSTRSKKWRHVFHNLLHSNAFSPHFLAEKRSKICEKGRETSEKWICKKYFWKKIRRTRVFCQKNTHLSFEQFSENDLRIFRSISGSCCCFTSELFSNCFIFFASYRSNRQLALFFGKFNWMHLPSSPSLSLPLVCVCAMHCVYLPLHFTSNTHSV